MDMAPREFLLSWFSTARPDSELNEWVKGRSWLARLPLVLISAYYFVSWCGDNLQGNWFSGLNIGIHEGSHLVTAAFGQFICAAAGSVGQCLAPVIAAVVLLRQRDFTGLGFCLTWLASNLFYVALYVADAPFQNLPLVTVSRGEALHDWAYLLGDLGMLGAAGFFAGCLRLAGYACALGGVLWGAWVLYVMARANR